MCEQMRPAWYLQSDTVAPSFGTFERKGLLLSEDYVREKLSLALDALAASAEPIQTRLYYAAMAMSMLESRDFAEAEERELWQQIKQALTAESPRGDEGSFLASTSRLDDESAVALAKDIVRLHGCYFPLIQ